MLGEQTVMPAWHGFAGTQIVPAEQVAQLPAWQTMFAPQTLPLATSPDSMQTGVPVLQAMVPLRQGLPGTTQSMPCTQAAQAPVALQTMSVPQDVPAATFVFVSVHDGAAPEQTSVPVWHLFVGVHAPPIWQVAHVPAWQTMPVPHVVPFGLLSVSVQTGAPVVQTMLPTRQGLPVTSQAMPSTQLSQLPLWQTLSMSQRVPFACRSVSSMHDMAPPSMQTNIPLWQALAGTHAPPATQVGASTAPAVHDRSSTRRCRRSAAAGAAGRAAAAAAAACRAFAELPPMPPGPASSPVIGSRRNPPHPAASAVEQTAKSITRRDRSSSIPTS